MGGYNRATVERNIAIGKKNRDIYLANPKKCLHCNLPILPKNEKRLREVKRKVFCSRNCSGSYNGFRRIRIKKLPIIKKRILPPILSITKEDLFAQRKNWQSARSHIRRHAQLVYEKSNNKKKCAVCGYHKFIEICHIKSVSSFSGRALIVEINDLKNLIALCPNHHWELDHGVLDLKRLSETVSC